MSLDQRKLRVLTKLAEHGADTEKKITALSFKEIMDICKDSKALAISEMQMILDFQEAIKVRRGIAFLLDGKEEVGTDGNDNGKSKGHAGRNDNLELGGAYDDSGDSSGEYDS